MSILEKIIKTENEVQNNIDNAHKKALKLISDAREKSNLEAEKIRLETNEKISELNKSLEIAKSEIAKRLNDEVQLQHRNIEALVKSKTNKVVERMFNEAIK